MLPGCYLVEGIDVICVRGDDGRWRLEANHHAGARELLDLEGLEGSGFAPVARRWRRCGWRWTAGPSPPGPGRCG